MHPDAVIATTLEAEKTPPSSVHAEEEKPRTKWQKTYGVFGFQKGYNFPLFIIFAGAMLGFSLARLSYLNVGGSAKSSFASGAIPGDWYWYSQGSYRIGITLHLATVVPAGILMVWQFVPIIRHKFLLFHRINGYIIMLLVFLGNIGALMICRRAFGGTVDTQAAVGTLVILTTTSIGMAYYNIKRLQIEQHRAWMLRAMFYLGTIISLRLIMVASAQIVSKMKTYYTTMSCEEINFIYGGSLSTVHHFYPDCNKPDNSQVVVHADWSSGLPEQIGASFDVSFGMAFWMAIILHVVGVEIYLALTPREANRLRQVSYERQLERGFKNPGSAGLTSDRLGDADPWKPNL